MSYNDRDRVLALAGIFQSAYLVQQYARRGMADSEAVGASIGSLFETDPASVAAVFGGLGGVRTGLHQLRKQLEQQAPKDLELTRYVIALMQLERKLAKQATMLATIGEQLERCRERREHFPLLHPNILAQIAGIYADTLSHLSPRIMVNGESLHLQNPDTVNKIRACLLAGIRAARLWRQVGGRRTQILFGRRKLLTLLRELQ